VTAGTPKQERGWLEMAKILFAKFRLSQKCAKCSKRNIARVHRHLSLASVNVAQDHMGSGLTLHNEPRALQFCEHLTCFVRHRQECPGLKRGFRTAPGSNPHVLFFSQPDACQIECRLTGAFQPQAVRSQTEGWDVSIKISWRKVPILDSLEKNPEIHTQTIRVLPVVVNAP
jgi:hypothetical protein